MGDGSPSSRASALQIALLLLASAALAGAFLMVGAKKTGREKFVSKHARRVHAGAQKVFAEGGGDAPYSRYKAAVPGADPVQYTDVRALHLGSRLTPEAVQAAL
jgi:hypothetical protein